MLSQTIESWPIIPLSVVAMLAVIAIGGCLTALLYDSGARDTGRVTQFGLFLLGLGIVGCLGVGLWNMTVSFAKFSAHRQAVATSEPMRE